ncbi:MAG: hypothetical protein Ct9H300mP27_09450 [Chloroflexota bacterium]|nr:MAG: hypothetical protein Ct9H300mP27_09450 [Chloroflexota bacterium]
MASADHGHLSFGDSSSLCSTARCQSPEEVRDAFDDVLRARQERDTRINQAEPSRQT